MTDTELPAISHLSLETKRALLLRLARELIAEPDGSMSLTDGVGEMMIYRVPSNAKQIAEDYAKSLSEEEWEHLHRLSLDTDNTFSLEEALEIKSASELESSR